MGNRPSLDVDDAALEVLLGHPWRGAGEHRLQQAQRGGEGVLDLDGPQGQPEVGGERGGQCRVGPGREAHGGAEQQQGRAEEACGVAALVTVLRALALQQVAERVRSFQAAGVTLLLLQSSPQLEEMERFAEQVMPLVH